MDRLQVLYTLVCDDVRREENGKEIIIGVYSSDIRVPRFPVNLRLVFWMQISIEKPGHIAFQFRIRGPNEVELSTGDVGLEVLPGPSHIGTIALGPVPLQIQSGGELILEIRSSPESNWESTKSIQVVQADITKRT